ncbi:MAG TPA: DUF1501 domain-containing protein [Phycisphaerales bacterium]|nr:DUF1501 domain-containing protein [Phycisphaerales bacterium]HMP35894.1 DUF1501 domain-containing protein [Phycisphaerales bacterium]
MTAHDPYQCDRRVDGGDPAGRGSEIDRACGAADGATDPLRSATRRQFFRNCTLGLGSIGLASLLAGRASAAPALGAGAGPGPAGALPPNALAARAPHFAPRAKRVVYLFMNGAPSQLDLFDPKPRLVELDMTECPPEFLDKERFAFIRGTPKLLGSPYRFDRHGNCGAWVSELLPHTAGIVDDIAIVRSLQTDQFNHSPAELFINTGFARPGRPSMGSWVTYGIGSESEDLPGFVVLLSGGGQPSGGHSCWSAGFLPTHHQGVQFRGGADPVLFVRNPEGIDDASRRRALAALGDLDRIRLGALSDPEIASRIANYELAYRMQSSVPGLTDISDEPQEVLDLYGAAPGRSTFANNCLLARRLLQRGVRFVQLYHRGWDSHGTSPDDDIVTSLRKRCDETDQACAALVKDLKRLGMLEETLVVWGGEFGRTPMNEARNGSTFLGRDHHARAFTMWFAGGGVKAGVTIGATDEIGYDVVADPCHVHDLQATILHLLGLDHLRLTHRFQGRDYRLTDVHGHVFTPLLA